MSIFISPQEEAFLDEIAVLSSELADVRAERDSFALALFTVLDGIPSHDFQTQFCLTDEEEKSLIELRAAATSIWEARNR